MGGTEHFARGRLVPSRRTRYRDILSASDSVTALVPGDNLRHRDKREVQAPLERGAVACASRCHWEGLPKLSPPAPRAPGPRSAVESGGRRAEPPSRLPPVQGAWGPHTVRRASPPAPRLLPIRPPRLSRRRRDTHFPCWAPQTRVVPACLPCDLITSVRPAALCAVTARAPVGPAPCPGHVPSRVSRQWGPQGPRHQRSTGVSRCFLDAD